MPPGGIVVVPPLPRPIRQVKIDGKEESHDSLKTKNEAEIREVIKWILAK